MGVETNFELPTRSNHSLNFQQISTKAGETWWVHHPALGLDPHPKTGSTKAGRHDMIDRPIKSLSIFAWPELELEVASGDHHAVS